MTPKIAALMAEFELLMQHYHPLSVAETFEDMKVRPDLWKRLGELQNAIDVEGFLLMTEEQQQASLERQFSVLVKNALEGYAKAVAYYAAHADEMMAAGNAGIDHVGFDMLNTAEHHLDRLAVECMTPEQAAAPYIPPPEGQEMLDFEAQMRRLHALAPGKFDA